MAAYLIVRMETDDPASLKAYQQATPAVISQFGGRFLVRGGPVLSLEGPEESRRIVVIEFPDVDTAKSFYHSPEYAAAMALRLGKAKAEIILVEGMARSV